VLCVVAAFILFATRWPIAPRYLYYFDAVNFALALEEFNPQIHQPQPPGYPLFVGVIRLLHRAIPGAEQTLFIAGLLAAVLATVLIFYAGAQLLGSRAGALAAVLLVFNPEFWFGGLTNPVRVYLALCSVAVGLLAWRALRHPENPGWLYFTFGVLGLSAGFRPAVVVVLAPLLLWVWFRTGAKIGRLLIGAIAAGAAAAPWVAAASIASGGLASWLDLIWQYSNDQFRGSSAAFGAPRQAALEMSKKALVWNGTGALSWLWAVPFANRRLDAESRQKWAFLTVWFVPGFAFSALVHIGDPDHALATIPVLCIAGGAVLDSFLYRRAGSRLLRTALAVAAVNALLFFLPSRGLTGASSYRAVINRDLDNGRIFDTIRSLHSSGPMTIVHYNNAVTWRQLSYYFPDDYVLHLPERRNEHAYTLHGRKTVSAHMSNIQMPSPERIALVTNGAGRDALLANGWTAAPHNIYWRTIGPGASLAIGPHVLSAAPPPRISELK
jgi:4-amino-4-deoxy-L-arabinose transferase-like glycosyltransferase